MNKMQGVALSLALMFVVIGLGAQSPQWQWVAGGGGMDTDYGAETAMDNQGNLFVSGYFTGTAAFGSQILVSDGSIDIFVAKLDAQGNWLWALGGGGPGVDGAYGLATDGSGNVFVAGTFEASAAFGPYTLSSAGSADVFVAKIDGGGNWLWIRRAGGVNGDSVSRIATDGAGNAFLAGSFYGTATYGTDTLSSSGHADICVARISGDGNWFWARRAGGTGNDGGGGVSVDSQGYVFISGYFSGSAVFNSQTITSAGGTDVFAAKLDSGGNWLWASRAGGTSSDFSRGIAADGKGAAFLTGSVYASASFGAFNLTTAGGDDIFVAKVDDAGNWLWAVRAGGSSEDIGRDIAADAEGNAYLAGDFRYGASFGTFTLTSSGLSNIAVAKLDPDGNWIWAADAGGPSADKANGITADTAGNVCLTGYFQGIAGFGNLTLTAAGSSDVYCARISAPEARPRAPENTSLVLLDTDIQLSWDAVTQDVNGAPITPNYHIYADYGAGNGYELRGTIPDTYYDHIGGAQLDHVFYYMQATTDPATNILYIDAVDAEGNEITAEIFKDGLPTAHTTPAMIANYSSGMYYVAGAGYEWNPVCLDVGFSGIDRWVAFVGAGITRLPGWPSIAETDK